MPRHGTPKLRGPGLVTKGKKRLVKHSAKGLHKAMKKKKY